MHHHGTSYKYHEVQGAGSPPGSWGPQSSMSSSTSDDESDHIGAGGDSDVSAHGCWCTFSNSLPNNAYCIFVRVDEQFWLEEKQQPHHCHLNANPVLDELKAYYEHYLNENDRFRMLMNNSVLAIGRRVQELHGASSGKIESTLYGWLLTAITARCNDANIIMGNSKYYPWRSAGGQQSQSQQQAQQQAPQQQQQSSSHVSNSGVDGTPTFFAGWRTTAAYPIVGFISDWYESLKTASAYQHALLSAAKNATECLLADACYGSSAAGNSFSSGPEKPVAKSAITFGRPRFCCFLLCTRHFAQFGAAHRHSPSTPSQIDLLPLSRKLHWDVKRDRRRMAELMLGISYWLKRTAG